MIFKKLILIATLVALPSIAVAQESKAFDQGMQPILQSYLKIQEALASDKTTGVQKAAKSMAKSAKKLDASKVTGEHAKHYKDLPVTLRKAAETLSAKKDIDGMREALKELSKPMAMWGTMSKPKGIVVAFCSMAKGSWLQKKGDIRNPYFGKGMLSCGEVVGGDSAEKTKKADHGEMNHGAHSGH